MLTAQTLQKVYDKTDEYWRGKRASADLISRTQGKEIGHQLADWVDDQTCAVLTLALSTRRQHGKTQARSRSMGDIWIEDDSIFHPINVKTGVVGAEGQPNLVSLKKVLNALLGLQIDSYYLLFVKFAPKTKEVTPSVYVADMLDMGEFLTFDSGPGQLMLKAAKFFDATKPGVYRPQKSPNFADRVSLMLDMLEDGERRLRQNRDADLKKYRSLVERFRGNTVGSVTPATQVGLNLK
jgi:hypothetical protein